MKVRNIIFFCFFFRFQSVGDISPKSKMDDFLKILDFWMSLHPEDSVEIQPALESLVNGNIIDRKMGSKMDSIVKKAIEIHADVCVVTNRDMKKFLDIPCFLEGILSILVKSKRRSIPKESANRMENSLLL